MSRQRPSDRLDQLIEAAIRVFSTQGYRRAQTADIAREAGVAPGTIYLYVESKEALFDLALRRALQPDSPLDVPTLPVPTPPAGATLDHVREQLLRSRRLPVLAAALDHRAPADPRAELTAIIRELYASNERYSRAMDLISRSRADWPELANVYYRELRRGLLQQLTQYLEQRVREGLLRRVPDLATAARLIVETIAWFARHRHGDPDSAMISDDAARETVVHVLANAFCPEATSYAGGQPGPAAAPARSTHGGSKG
jgi:AcrR family transcriptional regulator